MPEKQNTPVESLWHILLVEDNPDDIELTKRGLQDSGVFNELRVITDGEEALDYLVGPNALTRRLPVLVLLDLRLPRVDGLEVLKRIRTEPRTQQLPVIILTESDKQEDWLAGYAWKAALMLRKPVEFDRFIKVAQGLGVRWLLAGRPDEES